MEVEDIKDKIGKIKSQMEENLPIISSEIEELIGKKEQSVSRIERLLDTLLDYTQLGVGEEEFKRLNDYYATLNPLNAKFYEHAMKQ